MLKWSEIAENASSQGHKANVVKPLIGMVIILLVGSSTLFMVGNFIFANIVGGLAIILVVAFLVSYFFCLFTNPDLLRSEKYNLEKSAMAKIAVIGNSTTHSSLKAPLSEYVVFESKIIETNQPNQQAKIDE